MEQRLLGQLGQDIAKSMDCAALPVGIRPELADRRYEPGCAIGHDQERTREVTRSQTSAQIEPVFGSFALTETDIEQHAVAIERVAPGDQNVRSVDRRCEPPWV